MGSQLTGVDIGRGGGGYLDPCMAKFPLKVNGMPVGVKIGVGGNGYGKIVGTHSGKTYRYCNIYILWKYLNCLNCIAGKDQLGFVVREDAAR